MTTKKSKTSNSDAIIQNADENLTRLLSEFALNNYELRQRSKGIDVLYIRLNRIQPTVQLAVR